VVGRYVFVIFCYDVHKLYCNEELPYTLCLTIVDIGI